MSEQPVPFAMKCNATGPGIGGGAEGVEAQFTNGVLTVRVTKREEALPKSIEVRVE